MGNSELKTKTVSSLFWSFMDKFGHQIINLVSNIILMAIVANEDFGILATLAVFTAFSTILVDSGFVRALINRKNVSQKEYSSVFYFNVVLSIVLYLILFFCAPYIAKIFKEPLLESVARWIFLSIVINAFGLIQQTLLIKNADFRGLTKVNIPAVFIAAVIAIAMALSGFGLEALIAQQLVYPFAKTVFLWMYSKWRPVAYFNLTTLKSFMGFSNKLLITSLISAVFNNIYQNIIAYFYPNSMNRVADYAQANKYQDIPFGMISNTFRSVSMLILSEINQEIGRLKRVVSKIMKTISFLSFFLGFFMISIAEPVFEFVWKEKWLSAVPYFQILCLAGMISPFSFILNELFIARERADFFMNIEIVKRIIQIILIFMLFRFGISGLAWSWVIYMVITLVISLVLSKKLISYSLIDFTKDALPYLLVALLSVVIGYYSTLFTDNNLLILVIRTIVSGGSYWLISKALKLEMTTEIGEFFSSKNKNQHADIQ